MARPTAKDLIKGHLDALLLAILERGPLHGYALIAALGERSGGAFDLPEGAVYPALHRLERGGLLSSRWTVVAGRRRRVYALTAAGSASLAERRGVWRRFASAIGAVLQPEAGAAS